MCSAAAGERDNEEQRTADPGVQQSAGDQCTGSHEEVSLAMVISSVSYCLYLCVR